MNQMMMDEHSPLMLFDVAGGLRTLWQHRVLIIVTTLAIFCVGVFYIALTKPTYTAQAAILVDPRDARATNLDSVLPGIGADSAAISSQVSVIESRDLLSSVFDAEGLVSDPEFSDPGMAAKLISLVKPVRQLGRDAIFEKFQGLVSAQREGLTYVIDVSFKSRDPDKAARIVNAIVARYNAYLVGQTEGATDDASAALSGKIVGLQAAVSDAERTVQDFKSSHHIFDATTGGSVQSQIDQLTTQIGAAQDQANQAQSKYDQAIADGTSPQGLAKLAEIASSTATDKLRDDYNQRAAALANAQALFGPKHPNVVSLEAELSKLEGLMAREADRIIQELKANRDLATQNVGRLQANLASLREQGNRSDMAQVQLRELQRNADAARSVLDDFQKRAQETSQMHGLQISQIRVISSAVAPTQATWPKPLLLLPVSALLGLAAGCGLALAIGRRQPRAKPTPTPQDPAPKGRNSTEPAPQAQTKSKIPGLGTYRLPLPPGNSFRSRIKAARIEIATAEATPFARAALNWLSEVLGQLDKRSEPHIILFSSIGDGMVHSVAAELMGIALQRIKGKPLLIEIANWTQEPAPLRSSFGAAGAGTFRDAASGLTTLVVPVVADAAAARDIARRTGLAVDFILIAGRPMTDQVRDRSLAAEVDLEFIVASADRLSRAEEKWLAENLGDDNLARQALLVIDTALTPPAAVPFKPRLVTSDIRTPQTESARA
jgi:succinoglycan biosynthesis transport protein ExoP